MLYTLDHTVHLRLQERALRVKIEKLEAWMYMYRNGNIVPSATRHVLDIFILLIRAREEHEQILKEYSSPSNTSLFTN